MAALVGLSGSLRRASHNTALLRAAAGLMPEGSTLDVRTVHGIPLFDGDLLAEGLPAPVAALKDAIAAADGVILATPEYNASIPGVLKNAIDWLSRPASDIPRVFGGKAVAILGATTGRFGTAVAQNAWLPVLRALRMNIWSGDRVLVAAAAGIFDADGALVDEDTRRQVQAFVTGFAAFAARR